MIIIKTTPPDTCRITCPAAPGAKVVATGAEPLKGWTHVTNDPWKAVILALLLAAPLLAAAPVVQVEKGDQWTLYWDNTTKFKSELTPNELREGDKIHFDFVQKDGKMWLTELRRTKKADRD